MKSSLNTIAYTPFRALYKRDYFLAHPYDCEVYLVWMGISHGDVVKDGNDEHCRMVHVQWKVPYKKGPCNNLKLY
jgi:hypothetical protein